MGLSGKLNVNVGVLGHVDSGKTSLCKALSTTASTAAFDSNPQSKERGITLDLGFSSLSLESTTAANYNITLVDCPGHSSLIRTVIGGAQIMDIMLLIIDINKGMQPQTAECLILAHITSSHLIVVLNKVDLIPPDARPAKIVKITKLLRGVLSKTKFGVEPIVAVSAIDGDIGTGELKGALSAKIESINFVRENTKPFLMAVDHCFSIKGQGTIVTGTVLQGIVKINDVVEFPTLLESKKVKSIQSFRISVTEASAGDRIGICFPGLDSTNIERTVIAAPGVVTPAVRAGVLQLKKIPFFKKPIESKKKYHISIGYETVTARVTLFASGTNSEAFEKNQVYEFVERLAFEGKSQGPEQDGEKNNMPSTVFALLEFDKSVMTTPYSLVIGSDLQSEDESACRLAFSGKLVDFTQDKQYLTTYLPSLKIFKEKAKVGQLDRVVSENQLIAKGFCKKESNIDHLIGLKVQVVLGNAAGMANPVKVNARIESRFGQTDKVRLGVTDILSSEDFKLLKENAKQAQVFLNFKKYLYNVAKTKLTQ